MHESVLVSVHLEPDISNYWADLMHFWYSTMDSQYPISLVNIDLLTCELLPLT